MNKKSKFKKIINFLYRVRIIIILIVIFVIFVILHTCTKIELNVYILFITAIVIFWYSYETFLVRKEAQKNTILGVKPILVIYWYHPIGPNGELEIGNIGNGPALNIEFRISQFHNSGGYTNLRSFLTIIDNNIYHLKKDEKTKINVDSDLFNDYFSATKPEFVYGIKNNFAIILSYNDMFNNRYQTIVRVYKTEENFYLFKQTLFGSLETGELLKFPIHIITP